MSFVFTLILAIGVGSLKGLQISYSNFYIRFCIVFNFVIPKKSSSQSKIDSAKKNIILTAFSCFLNKALCTAVLQQALTMFHCFKSLFFSEKYWQKIFKYRLEITSQSGILETESFYCFQTQKKKKKKKKKRKNQMYTKFKTGMDAFKCR